MQIKIKFLSSALCLSVFLSGCANLAPKYETPNVALSERWIDVALADQSTAGQAVAAELGWREFFVDKRLQQLIETALTSNHDLRKAALNSEIAKQKYGITDASKLPTIGLSGSKRHSLSAGRTTDQYQVGLGVSQYELDFFGRVKNQSAAALNQYLQTREARDAAQISIINAVAKLYYQWRILEAVLSLSKRTLSSRKQSEKLVKLRFQEGLSSATDVNSAKLLVASTKANYQQQLRNALQAKNALSALVGRPIDRLNLPSQKSLSEQFSQRMFFIDTPSTVLLNRPDVRQMEYGLKAANANIGAARASMYPSIKLTGSAGFASVELSNLFDGVNKVWSFSPSIDLPIFDAGRRRANIKITKLQQQVALENYQATVQNAFKEVADALVAKATLKDQYLAEKDSARATSEMLRMTRLKMREGLADALNVLDVERANFSSSQGLLTTQLQMLTNQVNLYTYMGGGLMETAAKTE